MSIKSGKIIMDAGRYVIDRVQSAGPSALNIPPEKIYDLGSYSSIATVHDIPEIKFDLWDTSLPRNYRAIATNRDVSPL